MDKSLFFHNLSAKKKKCLSDTMLVNLLILYKRLHNLIFVDIFALHKLNVCVKFQQ